MQLVTLKISLTWLGRTLFLRIRIMGKGCHDDCAWPRLTLLQGDLHTACFNEHD
jgi:hypothetical protein